MLASKSVSDDVEQWYFLFINSEVIGLYEIYIQNAYFSLKGRGPNESDMPVTPSNIFVYENELVNYRPTKPFDGTSHSLI